jgi:hypothetical protein
LPGHPDFAHEHDVERCAQRLGNLETDADTAARQCQDDRLRIFEMRQFGGQLPPGRCAISKSHALASMNFSRN